MDPTANSATAIIEDSSEARDVITNSLVSSVAAYPPESRCSTFAAYLSRRKEMGEHLHFANGGDYDHGGLVYEIYVQPKVGR